MAANGINLGFDAQYPLEIKRHPPSSTTVSSAGNNPANISVFRIIKMMRLLLGKTCISLELFLKMGQLSTQLPSKCFQSFKVTPKKSVYSKELLGERNVSQGIFFKCYSIVFWGDMFCLLLNMLLFRNVHSSFHFSFWIQLHCDFFCKSFMNTVSGGSSLIG